MSRGNDSMADRVYEEFEPISRWSSEPGFDTLTIYLPGFRKEQLKVQVTSTRKLRVLGERPTQGNNWIRFRKEFPIESNTNVDSISAKFEAVNLVLRFPRPEKKARLTDQRPAPEKQSRGAERVHPPKTTTDKPAEKKEEASRGAEKVHLPKPAMEKPAEKRKDASRGDEKVQMPKPWEEEASREAKRVQPLKPAMEKLAEEKEETPSGLEKVKQKEDLNQEFGGEVKTFKESVEGFVREMMNNPRVTTGVVVGAAVVVLAAGIYAGRRLRCTFGDP